MSEEILSGALDVVVRFHAPQRIAELRRALFSLICQEYRPLTVRLVTQRFSPGDLMKVEQLAASLSQLDQGVTFDIINYMLPHPADARAALLNQGMKRANGRYLAFLDYDDTVYQMGYNRLINELQLGGCAIAFGTVMLKTVDILNDAHICEARNVINHGNDLRDLLAQNFCPIHTFVIDRDAVKNNPIFFDESLSLMEDYEFLLRFCTRERASFSLRNVFVGDYVYKYDGSNTVVLDWNTDENKRGAWERAIDFIEQRRTEILVSEAIQEELGLSIEPGRTIRSCLDALPSRKDSYPEPLPDGSVKHAKNGDLMVGVPAGS